MTILFDRAAQITEAAALAELDFFRDIDPKRRITMVLQGHNHEFIAKPHRREGEPPMWAIRMDQRSEAVLLKDSSLPARVDWIRCWKELRAEYLAEYLAEIEVLEAYVLERWP